MAKIQNVEYFGNQLMVRFDDDTAVYLLPTSGSLWLPATPTTTPVDPPVEPPVDPPVDPPPGTGTGDIYDPWGGQTPSGSWLDHASYSAGGLDFPDYLEPIHAPAAGTLRVSGGSGEYLAGNVGSAGVRSVLMLDASFPRIRPGESRPPEAAGNMVAIVFQHQSEQRPAVHYNKGDIIGVSGNTGNGVYHSHVHGLTASGGRVDYRKFIP